MRYEAFGLSPVDYGVMNPTGEKFAFKSMSVFIAIKMLVHRKWSRFINELATKKGLDCGHGNGSQQRKPSDEQTTETPFLSRCHMILMFKTVSGSHYSILIADLHSWAGATLGFFRILFRLALFISYLLLQVCPYKIQPEKQGKLIWITGPPGLGMKQFFFILTFTF